MNNAPIASNPLPGPQSEASAVSTPTPSPAPLSAPPPSGKPVTGSRRAVRAAQAARRQHRRHASPDDQLARLTAFLHEAGMLRHTPRSGYLFLGSGQESVAEHSHRTAIIGYTLARLTGADPAKTALLCLFHDLGEARTGDLNYVNQLYGKPRERDAVTDALRGTGLDDILDLWDEHHNAATPEAVLAHDADQLDLLLNLKRELDLGNPYAARWIASAVQRLRTPLAKDLALTIQSCDHSDWWYSSGSPSWWIHRRKDPR